MSFRMFIQPLTEKTANIPFEHELTVNTTTGDFSMVDSKGSTVSPTRDIKYRTAIMEQMIKIVKVVSEEVDKNIRDIEAQLKTESGKTNTLEFRLEEIKKLDKNISTTMDLFRSKEIANTNNINAMYASVTSLVNAYITTIPDLTSLERRAEHYYYLKSILVHNKNQLAKDVKEIKKRYATVKKLVNTKQDVKPYTDYVNGLVKKYNNYSKNSKVQSVSFKYNTPKNGH